MAGDWLKIESCTPDKPEVIGIASILNIEPAHAFGCLFLVWRWFDQHTKEGNAKYVTKVTVDSISGNDGFADAMEKVGWLIVKNDEITLPHFDRHCGETAKTRALTAKRVAKCKAKKVTENTLPREEKRREEVKPKKPLAGKTCKPAVTIQTFLQECKDSGEERISKTDEIFDFAEKNNIPLDMIRVAWQEFVRRHKENGKRQKDWRRAFRNCVRGNWFKLWFIEADGTVKETSQYRALKKDLGDNHVSE